VTYSHQAEKLVRGRCWSTRDEWDMATSSAFASGVGYYLGVRSPSDLAGRGTRIDWFSGSAGDFAERQRGYEWAKRVLPETGPAPFGPLLPPSSEDV
jgi:hypothetical protein